MIKWLEHAVVLVFSLSLDICDCLLSGPEKYAHSVIPQCTQCNGQCTDVGEPENAMKLSLTVWGRVSRDKVCKASKTASETHGQTLHRQEQNRTHMIGINTYHLACAKGSVLQCCSFTSVILNNITYVLQHSNTIFMPPSQLETINCVPSLYFHYIQQCS